MGFLKFFKRKNLNEDDMLDLPPIPPPTEKGEELGLSSLDEEIPPPPIGLMEESPADMLLPPLPETEDISNIGGMPMQEYPQKISASQRPGIQTNFDKIYFSKEKTKQKEPTTFDKIESTPSIRYLNVEKYKRILDELALSKSDAVLADKRFSEAHSYTEIEGKIHEKLKSELADIQKKLVIIDKVLAQ